MRPILTDDEILAVLGEDKDNDPELCSDVLEDARAVIAAYEAKLREQEPVAVVVDSDSLESVISPAVAVGSELYLHTAPIPEGLLDLLAIIHRDGGHYTDEHGIDKAINDAKDKVWAMLAAARSGE